jgi:hypothetical protein
MNTFEQAQAAARAARLAIDKLEAMHKEASDKLAIDRKVFVAAEASAVDMLKRLENDIGEARRELQSALQRQNDAPLIAEPEGGQVATEDANAALANYAVEGGTLTIGADAPQTGQVIAEGRLSDDEPWPGARATSRVNPITGAIEQVGG